MPISYSDHGHGQELTLDGSNINDHPDFLTSKDPPEPIFTEDSAAVAPWLVQDAEPDEAAVSISAPLCLVFAADTDILQPPTPPPKQNKFGFVSKPSFGSFAPVRGGIHNNTRHRAGESSIAVSYTSTMSTDTLESTVSSSSRKPRSTRDLFPRLLKKKSNVRLTADSDRQRSISVTSPPPVPFLDISANYTSTSLASTSFTSSRSAISQPSTSPPLRTSPPSRFGKGKSKNRTNLSPPQPPAKDPREPEFTLDTNLEEMDGIIDIGARPDPQGSSPTRDSFESSRNSIHSEWESFHPITPVPAQMAFNIPFNAPGPSIVTQRPWTGRSSIADTVSPMSPTPPAPLDAPPPTFDTLDSWEAPESWAVERVGEDPGEPDYSSSDESASARPPSIGPNGLINGNKKSRHRKSTRPLPSKTAKQVLVNKPFKVRIYRADNTYHVASIGLHVTVADLAPVLNSKLLFETKMEMHRLYLKERGRGTLLLSFSDAQQLTVYFRTNIGTNRETGRYYPTKVRTSRIRHQRQSPHARCRGYIIPVEVCL